LAHNPLVVIHLDYLLQGCVFSHNRAIYPETYTTGCTKNERDKPT